MTSYINVSDLNDIVDYQRLFHMTYLVRIRHLLRKPKFVNSQKLRSSASSLINFS